MLVPSSRGLYSPRRVPLFVDCFWLYTQLLLGSVWCVWGRKKRGRDEPVNAAIGIIAIYCENKMKRTLCQSCLIVQQEAYTRTTATRLSLLALYISLFLFAIILY